MDDHARRPFFEEEHPMAVITIFRQVGARGRYVAANLARTLDYNFSDYQNVERILLRYGYSQVRDVYETVPDFWDRFTKKGPERDKINSLLRLVTRAEAQHGNVVMLGRGCFAALQGLSDVLNVRIKASVAVRIERVMEEQQMTRSAAAAFVDEKDRLVAEFVKTSYGVSPDDPTVFDLVIDTAKIDPDAAVQWLAEAAGSLMCDPEKAPCAGGLQVDPVIADAVRQEFERMRGIREQRRGR